MDNTLSSLVGSAFQYEAVSLISQNGVDMHPSTIDIVPLRKSPIFFSNYVVHVLLDMLANGYKNKKPLKEFHRFTLEQINEIRPKLLKFFTLAGTAGGPKINLSTAIWVHQSVKLSDPYDKVMKDKYNAHSKEFKDVEDAKKQVNDWISKIEGGLAVNYFGNRIVDDTRLILAAALDFKGEWAFKFENAGLMDFTLFDGKTQKIECMRSTEKHIGYQYPGYKVLKIPFQQDKATNFSMLIYIPDEKGETDMKMLRGFIGDYESVIHDYNNPTQEITDHFVIPKFTLRSSGYLAKHFLKDYKPDAMENPATNLIVQNFEISGFLEINETGPTAAAVSAYFIRKKKPTDTTTTSAFIVEPSVEEKLVVDHPFIFFIRDNKLRRMLFSGVLTNPVLESASNVREGGNVPEAGSNV